MYPNHDENNLENHVCDLNPKKEVEESKGDELIIMATEEAEEKVYKYMECQEGHQLLKYQGEEDSYMGDPRCDYCHTEHLNE